MHYMEGKKEMIKKISIFVAALLLMSGMTACGEKEESTRNPSLEDGMLEDQPSKDQEESSRAGLHHIEIEVAGYGTIYCELDADAAPITVQNFLDLAEAGFYDGLTFHRVVYGFVIQGGDPLGNGTGGSEQNITGEFSANGYENTLSHTRGVLSMARAQDYNSASSQFFIMHQDATYLDGQYAAFGYVTEGMDIVDAIVENTPVQDVQSGFVAPENQPVITKVTVID